VPTLSRWCVRAALIYLVAGMAIGSWMLVQEARGKPGPGDPWPELHAHVLLVGFLLLLIMGVAYWMFPKVRGARPGREGGWIAFGLVNAGLLLRVVAQPRVVDDAGEAWRWALGAAAVLPTLGVVAFAVTILPRVRAAMSPEEARRLRERSRDGTGGPSHTGGPGR
jgi:hypothetical protein